MLLHCSMRAGLQYVRGQVWFSFATSHGAERCHFLRLDSSCASGVLLPCSGITALSTIVPFLAEFFRTDKSPRIVLHRGIESP